MATSDDMVYIRNRCNRILTMIDLRSRTTFSIDSTADSFGDASFPVTQGMKNNLDQKITDALSELKARAAVTTYP